MTDERYRSRLTNLSPSQLALLDELDELFRTRSAVNYRLGQTIDRCKSAGITYGQIEERCEKEKGGVWRLRQSYLAGVHEDGRTAARERQ